MYSSIRAVARSFALRIPPLRRLYFFALQQRDENIQLKQTLDRLRASNASMGAQIIEQSTAIATAERAAQRVVDSAGSGRESALCADRDRAREQLANMREEAAAARAELEGARRDLQEMRAKLSMAESALTRSGKVADEREAERLMLHQQLEQLRTRLSEQVVAVAVAERAEKAAAEKEAHFEADRRALRERLEQYEARLSEHAMAEARVALMLAELEGEGDLSATKALRAELALVRHERNLILARGVSDGSPDMQALGARLAELEEAVRVAYESVERAHAERDAARLELEKANQEFRVSSAENMARVLGKLSLVEYAMKGGSVGVGQIATATTNTLYLDLLEASLTGSLDRDGSQSPWGDRGYDPEKRMLGRDWPERALTMIGSVRMRNLRRVVERILADDVPGDLIETGVWRGGACIYMRGILQAFGDASRKVWVADSFRGLPPPSPDQYPADAGDQHSTFEPLAVSLEEVRANFERYGLLDERVQFLPGWFKDTLPSAPIKRLSLLRLDGDMYESTIQALDALYGKLSPNGFVIVDDFELPGCRKAIEDFRAKHNIDDRIEEIDGASVFWRKAAGPSADVVLMAEKRRSEQPN